MPLKYPHQRRIVRTVQWNWRVGEDKGLETACSYNFHYVARLLLINWSYKERETNSGQIQMLRRHLFKTSLGNLNT